MSDTGNVVLCEYLEKETLPLKDNKGIHTGEITIERLVPPIPLFARSALALSPFPLPKVPVKVSQYWTFKTEAGDAPTLPVVVFQIFAFDVYNEFIRLLDKVSPIQEEELLQDKDAIIRERSVEEIILILRNHFRKNPFLGDKMIEKIQQSSSPSFDSKKKQILTSLIKIYQGPKSRYLNFYGPPGTIETIPYCQLLQHHEKSGATQKQIDLNGKAVFVGLSESLRLEQKDGFHTVFSQPNGLDISGVEIAASAFANMIEDMPIRPLVFPIHHATIFLWGASIGILCFVISPVPAGFSVICFSVLYLYVALMQFKNTGSWYPIVNPLFFQVPMAYFGTILWKYFDTNRERQNIRRAFERYLPEKEVERFAKDPGDIKTHTEIVYGTCLFTDAEQYTAFSENLDPKELTSFMNKYYETIIEPVSRYNGHVSDFTGDSTLSIWASTRPNTYTSFRKKACLAALDIYTSDTLYLPTRIGLHSGYISLGSVGAINRYEYRPFGDIVNTAKRIEQLNKELQTWILVSEEVLHQIDGFLTRKVGKFILKGKSKPETIYELISRSEESSEQQRRLTDIFAKGLNAYYKRSWEEAIKTFDELIKTYKQDGPSTFYLLECEKYKANQPGENWNGVVQLKKQKRVR
jgi:adenylate cyclase